MRKAYLLAFSHTLGTRQQVQDLLNKIPQVITWRADLPFAIYLISEASASTLSKLIREATGGKGRYILAEINENKQGWLTPESWYLINNKKQKPKEPSLPQLGTKKPTS